MSERNRRHFDRAFNAKIVRRRSAGKDPVSNLAAELEIRPSLIHQWVNLVLEQAERAFDRSGRSSRSGNSQQKRIEQSEAKIFHKNEVIAELMEDNPPAVDSSSPVISRNSSAWSESLTSGPARTIRNRTENSRGFTSP